MMEGYQQERRANGGDTAPARYAQPVTAASTIDLRRLRLRPGEVRRGRIDVELDPFLLGGQRYESSPEAVPVDIAVTQASGATVFDLRLEAHLAGPCMRCLGYAAVDVAARARELYDPAAPPGDQLRSDYVVEDQLEVGTWARDAIALALPEQILCREDCAGLCPVCGKDLNAEPHEHAERDLDPRWAPLEQLRDQL
jgi:uncharacterized protein